MSLLNLRSRVSLSCIPFAGPLCSGKFPGGFLRLPRELFRGLRKKLLSDLEKQSMILGKMLAK